MTSFETVFCPAENGVEETARKSNFAANGYLSNPDLWRAHVATGSVNGVAWNSYFVRFKRYNIPNQRPALTSGAYLAVGDLYLHNFQRGILSRHSSVSLMSDAFYLPTVTGKSYLNFYHRDGMNVVYSDGHARWIADKNTFIINYGPIANLPLRFMRGGEEDIWDAFDGDIGNAQYNYVTQLW